ncbi:hypothetical protein ASZ78_000748, partial [Callipepla squamata]
SSNSHDQPPVSSPYNCNCCYPTPEMLKKTDIIVLGAHLSSKAEKEQQRFKIKHLFSYPQLDRDSKENDIMLLKVLLITTVLLQKKYH